MPPSVVIRFQLRLTQGNRCALRLRERICVLAHDLFFPHLQLRKALLDDHGVIDLHIKALLRIPLDLLEVLLLPLLPLPDGVVFQKARAVSRLTFLHEKVLALLMDNLLVAHLRYHIIMDDLLVLHKNTRFSLLNVSVACFDHYLLAIAVPLLVSLVFHLHLNPSLLPLDLLLVDLLEEIGFLLVLLNL